MSATSLFAPDKNLALELVRGTEAAVMASGRWMGRGNKNEVDRAAVEAMRYMLNTVSMNGVVVIGEGEKDEAPMLANGESLGTGEGPDVDIAVDPIDGTRLMAHGLGGALSVVAAAERGAMFSPKNLFYLDKIVTGPEAADFIDIEAPIHINIRRVAKAKSKAVEDVTVIMLDRPRNEAIREEVRKAGARIRLIPDGDIGGALATCGVKGTSADLLLGSGGSPEAVITACAVKCLGGSMQCRPYFRNEADEVVAMERGIEKHTILDLEDLVRGENVFFAATGASDGDLLKGVAYSGAHIHTWSLCMRGKSGTVRYIEAIHSPKKLSELGSSIDYSPGASSHR
ncbi:MAG: class II fructose-bisphosphatase [Synergistaceae bacterium]|jgi:fructose-1,6-bisphosphatase II|nr:class II fructose-bisphosphatase [Synergistaceae bacterium]